MDGSVAGGTDGRGWWRVAEFMVSGAPGSFILWALLAYALWSVLTGRRGGPDGGGSGGGFGDCDGDGGGD